MQLGKKKKKKKNEKKKNNLKQIPSETLRMFDVWYSYGHLEWFTEVKMMTCWSRSIRHKCVPMQADQVTKEAGHLEQGA